MLTPIQTNSWQKAIAPVMTGIIFSVCPTSCKSKTNVEEVDARKKTRRRGTCGGEIETNDEFSVEDCQSVYNSTVFECIASSSETLGAQNLACRPCRHGETSMEKPVAETLNGVVLKETKCWTSTSTRWSGESSCLRLLRRQYILDKITKIICVQPRIRTSKRSKRCLIFFAEIVLESDGWDTGNIYDWLKFYSMNDNDFATRQSDQVVESKGTRFSDSVLCRNKIHEHPWSIKQWKDKIEWFMNTFEYCGLVGIDGEAFEIEWKKFPGYTILELLYGFQRKIAKNRIRLEEFEDRIIFMSMHNDIDRTKDGNQQMCVSNSIEVKAHANRFPKGHWSILGSGTEEKWYGTHTFNPNGGQLVCRNGNA